MYKETQTASPIHLAPPRLPGPTGKIDLSREKDQGKDKPTLQIKAQKKPQIVSKEPMKKDLTKQVLTATAPGMKDLEFIIKPDRTEYGSIHPIRVIFTLTNHTAEALSVLKWYTPLEGLKSNILHVKRSGKSVPYVGIVAKRGIPLPKDYVTLGPGNSVSVEMDLSEGYDITTPGDYTAQLVSGVLRVAQQKPTVKVTQPKFVMKNLKSNTVSFKLIQERKSQLHLAPAALGAIRQTQKEAKLRPIHTETVGASNAQSSVLVKAHQNAVGLALNSRFNLLGTAANEKPNAEPYKTWFGSYDRDRWLQVTKNFDEIYEALHKRVVFDCTGQGCDPNWVAFVSKKNPYVIHICPLFWTTPDAGTDSKPGVIIHEVSHFNCVANTEDFAYNTSNCQYLANRNVDQAVQNADSHEYFAESLHTLKWEQLPDRSYSQYLHLRASNGFDLFGHADTGWVSIQDGTYPSSTFLIKNLTGNLLRSGDQVQLVLTDRTHYLSDNGTEVKANSTVAGQSETFQIIWATTITEMYQWLQQRGPIVHGDSVVFRTNKGTYLGLEHANDTAIEFNFYPRLFSNSEKIGDLERFKIFLPNMEPIGHGTWGMQKND
jgi:peptidyl-Lys metalloendopeptidase